MNNRTGFFASCLLSVSLLLVSMTILSCDDSSGKGDSIISCFSSELDRNLSPDATSDETGQLIADNADFAFDLFSLQTGSGKNVVFSPYSLSLAMAMTCGGADGNTAAEIAGAFHYLLPADRFHNAFNSVDLVLQSRQYTDPENGAVLKLTVANAFWGQTDYHFQDTYLDLLALNYGSGIYLLDFRARPDECTDTINGWIDEKTEGLIKNAIPDNVITNDTRAVLATAIYFYGNWDCKFSKDKTTSDPFYLYGGSQVATDTMHQEHVYGYYENDDACSVELPYAGGRMSMLVVMPKSDFGSYEAGLSPATIDGITSNLDLANVDLSLPKFKVEYSIDALEDELKSMGMIDAFSPTPNVADFSGITGDRDLYISDIIHKAVISVDEEGSRGCCGDGSCHGPDEHTWIPSSGEHQQAVLLFHQGHGNEPRALHGPRPES